MNSISNAYSKVAGSGISSVNWITVSTQIFADHSNGDIWRWIALNVGY